MKLLRFLQYNNAVPIALSVMLVGAGSAFAATNPDAILSSQQTIVSVDNTYIAHKDLSTYTPEVKITGVTEDADNYYVAYDFTTIDIKNYVWQDITRQERMQVSKSELNGGDLGLFVTKRLHDVVANELAYLRQVQEKEQKAVTQQTVATTYSGLIGKFLDASTETLPGYTPVVTEPAPGSSTDSQAAAVAAAGGSSNPSSVPMSSADNGRAYVALQVLGNNPAQLALRSSFIDLGVVLLDPFNTGTGYHTFLDGAEVSSPNIDTSVAGVHVIEYRAVDRDGHTALARRIVLVGDAADPGGEISSTGTPVAPPPPAPAPQPAAPQASAEVVPEPATPVSTEAPAASEQPAASASSTPSDQPSN